ncbi:hypothetical protein AX17_001886 [Amanita inopinata Kibby_2008]|nr:hypothetical protein AX17_001886 [Amanita inopinata Kibby_2008]
MSRSKTATTAAARGTKQHATHPSWIEMIKACISAHPDNARQGVSRPQIKKFVEQTYKLEMNNAQNVMLSRALGSGSEKGVFVLPKGPSGRVKLAPKTKAVDTSAKENKPAVKPKAPASKSVVGKPSAKQATKPMAKAGKPASKTVAKGTTKKASGKATGAPKSAAGTTRTSAMAKKSTTMKAKPENKKVPTPLKKVRTGKSKSMPMARRPSSTSQRASAKKAITGGTSVSKAKAAAKKTPVKGTSSKGASKPTGSKAGSRKATRRS